MADESGRGKERWRRKRWWIPTVLLVLLGVLGLLVLVIMVPPRLIHMRQPNTTGLSSGDRAKIEAQFETDRTKAENDLRASLVTTLAGLAVVAGTVVAGLNLRETQRQNRESSDLQRRGQVTERFGKAIDQLGERGKEESERLDVRMGAIYSLEQIARDSPELHWPIVEILTAFIREHTKASAGDQAHSEQSENDQSTASPKVAADIQAALTVLCRRNSDSDLGQVDLSEANLQGADLYKANLQDANLYGVDLRGATLMAANLRGAQLFNANLQGALLFNANLQGVLLFDANLQNARGLTQKQLDSAIYDDPTKPPPGLTATPQAVPDEERNEDESDAPSG